MFSLSNEILSYVEKYVHILLTLFQYDEDEVQNLKAVQRVQFNLELEVKLKC